MKKAIIAAVIVIVVLSITSLFIYYKISELRILNNDLEEQNSLLQEQITNQLNSNFNVKIINLTLGSGGQASGLSFWQEIIIEIQNNGPSPVGGITLDYDITKNYTIFYDFSWLKPTQMGVIHVGESKLIWIRLETNIYELKSLAGKDLVVTLMLDNQVLDEKTMVLPDLSL